MNHLKSALALAFMAGTLLCGNAWADHGHGGGFHGGGFRGGGFHGGGFHGGGAHVGVVIGGFWPGYWYDPFYYGYPYYGYYAPPTVAPVYIERDQSSAQPWYYCDSTQGYYPYVQQCPSGWRAVAPQPAQK